MCVYPFVRSYEWYLLEDAERRDMLVEHGKMARDYADVRANTVASFALGDYEWMLAFEADELHRIVDLMRAPARLRAPAGTCARRCRSTPAPASRSATCSPGCAEPRPAATVSPASCGGDRSPCRPRWGRGEDGAPQRVAPVRTQ